MTTQALLDGFTSQFNNLRLVVEQSADRVISDPPDPLFIENQNVFIKSYLVSACSILEAFIQDLAISYVDHLQARVNALNLPYNFINWVANHEKAQLEFSAFEGKKERKDISDLVSPNYHKTKKAFERIGIDIATEAVLSHKDFVSSIVTKRNLIVHHNDKASDLSFDDIIAAIDTFIVYANCLHDRVCSDPNLKGN